MLTRTELAEFSRFKRLSMRYVEKDYLNDIGLTEISRTGKALVFKGGTALYKFYGLNRFSEDLDFSVNKRNFDYETLKGRLIRAYRLLDIEVTSVQQEEHQRGITLVLLIKGPFYNGSRDSLARLPLDFSSRERPREHGTRQFRSIYPELPPTDIDVMEMKEIVAEKVRAIMTRDKPRDAFDLWFLLKNGVDMNVPLIERKLKLYGSSFSMDGLLSALKGKKRLWETDLRGKVIGDLPRYEDVLAEIEELMGKALARE